MFHRYFFLLQGFTSTTNGKQTESKPLKHCLHRVGTNTIFSKKVGQILTKVFNAAERLVGTWFRVSSPTPNPKCTASGSTSVPTQLFRHGATAFGSLGVTEQLLPAIVSERSAPIAALIFDDPGGGGNSWQLQLALAPLVFESWILKELRRLGSNCGCCQNCTTPPGSRCKRSHR